MTEILLTYIAAILERAYRPVRDGRSVGPSSTRKSECYFRFDSEIAAHTKCGMLDTTSRIRSDDVVALPATERLAYLRRAIDGSIVFTHGFGIEGQLIFHWICEQALDIDVVTLDTGRLFPETYQLWAETERRYGRRIRAIYPNGAALERLVAKQGIDGIYGSQQARAHAATCARPSRSIVHSPGR